MFFLGVHRAHWLREADVPLFVSRNAMPEKRLPRALGPWALDSGGFTELSSHGTWLLSPDAYAALVLRYREEVGNLAWASPQDWMCEPGIIHGDPARGWPGTHLTVEEHQRRTIENYHVLRESLGSLVVPVLQGWTLAEYERCIEMYDDAGIDLREQPLVGLGTVCRRQDTKHAERIVRALAAHGIRLHGFGVKMTGLARFWDALASCDSMAWSLDARMRERKGLPSCDPSRRKSCTNCLHYALEWRERVAPLFDPDIKPLWKETPCPVV